jgi:hypothetical protein
MCATPSKVCANVTTESVAIPDLSALGRSRVGR